MNAYKLSMELSDDLRYYSDRWNPKRLLSFKKKLKILVDELIRTAPKEYKKDYEKLSGDTE